MKQQRILVIIRDRGLASQLREALRKAEYRVWQAKDGVDGLKKLRRACPDLVVMERELSPVNHEDSFLRIRKATRVPIIVVGGGQNAVEMLELGADAYLPKPPDLMELTARVRAMLRRESVEGPSGGDKNGVGIMGISPGRKISPAI